MTWVRARLMRLLGTLGVGRRDDEIAEELQAHRDLLIGELRRSGLSDEDARHTAALTFGNLPSAAEAYRDQRGLPSMESWMRDVRLAIRSLWRTPMAFVSMIAVLGVGVGLSTLIAALFDLMVWQGLPVPEPDRVVRLSLELGGKFSRKVDGAQSRFSYPELMEYRQASHTLDSLAGMSHAAVLWRRPNVIKRIPAGPVTSEYFRVLEVTPALGRLLASGDAREPVVVISHQLWVTGFASDLAVLGQPMVLDRSTYIIVGVAPPDFIGTQVAPVDLWLPLEVTTHLAGRAGQLSEPNVSWLQAIGRLSADTPLRAAAAEAAVIAARLDGAYPGRHSTITIARATRAGQELVRSHDRGLFMGAATGIWALAGLLLLVCGSNVASLMLARGASRQKEFGVRAALGASRGRLAQQLVAEIGVIAGASAMLAIAMALLSIRVMALWLPTRFITASNTPLHVIGFALVFAILVALVCGLAPASQAMRADGLSGVKGDTAIFGARLPAARVRQALVAVQMAVSVILLVGATLLSRGVAQTFRLAPGYATSGIYLVQPDVGSTRAPNLVTDVRDTLAARTGIHVIGLSQHALFHGIGLSTTIDPRTSTVVSVRFNAVDESYFRALGVAPVVGRIFLPREPGVVLVNSSLARTMWGDDRAALNRQIQIPSPGAAGLQTVTIVGVIPTLQTTDVGVADEPTYYAPLSDRDRPSALLIVRATPGTPVALLVADAVRSVDGDALPDVTALDDQMAVATVPARAGAATAGTVGVLALLVAAIGIHGIVAHAVVSRTRDIGVHLALGATRATVLRFVLGWALSGVAIGLAVGVVVVGVVGLAFAGPVRRILLGIHPLDPVALLIAAGFLGIVILIAAYAPARRALRIEPLAALRHE